MDLTAIGIIVILFCVAIYSGILAFGKYTCESSLLPDDRIKWEMDTGCMVKNEKGDWIDFETYRDKIKTGDKKQ